MYLLNHNLRIFIVRPHRPIHSGTSFFGQDLPVGFFRMDGALIEFHEYPGTIAPDGFPGGMDEVRGYPYAAGAGNVVLFKLRTQVHDDLRPKVHRIIGVGADVEKQLGVFMDVRRMSGVGKIPLLLHTETRQYPMDQVKITTFCQVVIHVCHDGAALFRKHLGVVFEYVIGVFFGGHQVLLSSYRPECYRIAQTVSNISV